MKTRKTSQRSRVIVAKLVAIALLSLFFAISTQMTAANTLSPVLGAKTPSLLLPRSAQPERTPKEFEEADAITEVLSLGDANLYSSIFAAHKSGDWDEALRSIRSLNDRRLMGHVLADRFQFVPPTAEQMASWLNSYPDHPQAETIYVAAKKADPKLADTLRRPIKPKPWNSSVAADKPYIFDVALKYDHVSRTGIVAKQMASISTALRRNDPEKARDILVEAQAQKTLAGSAVADAQAAIAASLFYKGERDQARALSYAAAVANHPSGLWIGGLIAWEKADYVLSARLFSGLARHPALDQGTRSAAHFWSARSLARLGKTKESKKHLEVAARHFGGFYGFLAAQQLGLSHRPDASAKTEEPFGWSPRHREVLSSREAGWRALALLQIGEKAMAEEELRRLNPEGDVALHRAMKALADQAKIFWLSARLDSTGPGVGTSKNTLANTTELPWKPKNGFEIDRSLTLALVRHESRFNPEAVSHRGARGLMQIMPATAKHILDDDTVQPDDHRLLDPANNLALGQKYVRQLSRHPQIGDNLFFILAAYNAGPGKTTRWIEAAQQRANNETIDPLLFVESMPFRETRHYVKRVMAHYWDYQIYFDEKTITLERVAEDRWPQVVFQKLAPVAVKMASN